MSNAQSVPSAGRGVWLSLLVAFILGAWAAGCSKKPEVVPKVVLATVGERQITQEDFENEVARRRQARQPVLTKEILLEEMVAYEAFLQRAERAGLNRDPQIQREWYNLLIGKLKERELLPRLDAVEVTDEEARAEYEARLETYRRPAKIRLALLFLGTPSKMPEERRAEIRVRMEEAYRKAVAQLDQAGQAKPGARDFGALAINYSEDQASRYRGGDIGWLDEGQQTSRWPSEVLQAGFALENGRLSDVLETKEGFFLVLRTDSRPAFTTPFEQVQAALKQQLQTRKRQQIQESFRAETLRQAGSKIDHQALAAIVMPTNAADVALNHEREAEPPALPGAEKTANGN